MTQVMMGDQPLVVAAGGGGGGSGDTGESESSAGGSGGIGEAFDPVGSALAVTGGDGQLPPLGGGGGSSSAGGAGGAGPYIAAAGSAGALGVGGRGGAIPTLNTSEAYTAGGGGAAGVYGGGGGSGQGGGGGAGASMIAAGTGARSIGAAGSTASPHVTITFSAAGGPLVQASSGKCLTARGAASQKLSMQLGVCVAGSAEQQFVIDWVNTIARFVSYRNVANGGCMDVLNASQQGAQVVTSPCDWTNSGTQKWLYGASGGQTPLITIGLGRYLDSAFGSGADGTDAVIGSPTGSASQKWLIPNPTQS